MHFFAKGKKEQNLDQIRKCQKVWLSSPISDMADKGNVYGSRVSDSSTEPCEKFAADLEATPPEGEDATSIAQMRDITDNYNSLLQRATSEIRTLAGEKSDLQAQCEKVMVVNEELVGDIRRALQREAALKKENESMLRANGELFEEAQRLSYEEEKWQSERKRYQAEVQSLRSQLSSLQSKAGQQTSGREEESPVELAKLVRLGQFHTEEVQKKKQMEEAQSKLQKHMSQLQAKVEELEKDRRKSPSPPLPPPPPPVGEDGEEDPDQGSRSRALYHRTVSLHTQVKKLQERCRELERENGKLKSAGLSAADADLAEQQAARYEKLLEKNRALSEQMERVQAGNRALEADSDRLKRKCQNLEELLCEEEADINEVLELIKRMQVTSSSSPNLGPMCPAPTAASKLKL